MYIVLSKKLKDPIKGISTQPGYLLKFYWHKELATATPSLTLYQSASESHL